MIDLDGPKGIKLALHEGRTPEKLESEHTVRKLARGSGLYVGKKRVRLTNWNNAFGSYLISTCKDVVDAEPSDIVEKTKEREMELVELHILLCEIAKGEM
jgi:hypothetical protein